MAFPWWTLTCRSLRRDGSAIAAAFRGRVVVVVILGVVAVVIAVAGGEAREPAVAVEVTADADVVLEPSLVGAQPAARAARRHPGRHHAPHARAAVGAAHAGLQRCLPPHQARPRPGAHKAPEHAAVGAHVVVGAGDGVLAGVRHVEQVAPAPPRQEAPPGRLGEAGHAREVAPHRRRRRRRAAAEEQQLRQRRPPAHDPARGRARERGHHPRRTGDAELPPQHALRDGAQPPADAGDGAQRLGVEVEGPEHQRQDVLVQDPRVHVVGSPPRRRTNAAAPVARAAAPAPARARARAAARRAQEPPRVPRALAHRSAIIEQNPVGCCGLLAPCCNARLLAARKREPTRCQPKAENE